jgi:hypothetical protein
MVWLVWLVCAVWLVHFGRLIGWQVDRLAGWLDGWMVGWIGFGWLVGLVKLDKLDAQKMNN